MELERAIGTAILLGVALFVILIFVIFRERYRREEERQRVSDAAFEAEILASTLGARASSPSSFEQHQVLGFPTPAAPVEAGFGSPQDAGAEEHQLPLIQPFVSSAPSPTILAAGDEFHRQPADVTCAGVLRQMENAGMVEQHEGFLELHGNAKAAVTLKLKGGARCLVVPYFETEIFTQRNLKRFQLLVYVGRDGKATVLNSLEEVIAAKVAGRAGM